MPEQYDNTKELSYWMTRLDVWSSIDVLAAYKKTLGELNKAYAKNECYQNFAKVYPETEFFHKLAKIAPVHIMHELLDEMSDALCDAMWVYNGTGQCEDTFENTFSGRKLRRQGAVDFNQPCLQEAVDPILNNGQGERLLEKMVAKSQRARVTRGARQPVSPRNPPRPPISPRGAVPPVERGAAVLAAVAPKVVSNDWDLNAAAETKQALGVSPRPSSSKRRRASAAFTSTQTHSRSRALSDGAEPIHVAEKGRPHPPAYPRTTPLSSSGAPLVVADDLVLKPVKEALISPPRIPSTRSRAASLTLSTTVNTHNRTRTLSAGDTPGKPVDNKPVVQQEQACSPKVKQHVFAFFRWGEKKRQGDNTPSLRLW